MVTEEETRKRRDQKNDVCGRKKKSLIIGGGLQRETEAKRWRDTVWPLPRKFVVRRIRTLCAKIQTAQAFKTVIPPGSVWSSFPEVHLDLCSPAFRKLTAPDQDILLCPCSQHRKLNRILSRKHLHGDWPKIGPYHCFCSKLLICREKLPNREVASPGKVL